MELVCVHAHVHMLTQVCMNMCVHEHVCAFMHRPELYVGCLPQLLSIF